MMTDVLKPCVICQRPSETFWVKGLSMPLCGTHEQWTDSQILQYLNTGNSLAGNVG